MEIKTTIDPIINLKNFPSTGEEEFSLNTDINWIKELIVEVMDELGTSSEDATNAPKLEVDLLIKRKMSTLLKDHLVIKGIITGEFHAPCIRCLEDTFQEVEGKFSSCFVNSVLEKQPEFEDTSHVYDQEELELYFHEKGKVNLKELIHEQLFLLVEPLPLHDENCLGLCQVCGINKNTETCEHNC